MRCTYPLRLCSLDAQYTPVIKLPTIQTHYDIQLGATPREDRGIEVDRQTDKPTYLIGNPICHYHRGTYKLTDFMPESDWSKLREMARTKGFTIPKTELIVIQFMPVGWQPSDEYMEVDR
jgi:hypothetical protein